MREKLPFLLIVVLALSAFSSTASAGEKDRIHVEITPIEGSRLCRGTARGFIPYPPDVVFRYLLDYDRFVEFMPHMMESRVLERDGNSMKVYQKLNLPWPLANKWYRSIIDIDSEHHRLSWVTDEGNLKSCTGGWVVKPVEGGSMVIYTVVLDPGGYYPVWVVNSMQRRSLPAVIRSLREFIANEDRNQLSEN
ncbi:MAG: SRPBCC family protein [Candidatus Tritonobacter lacicola]|nr:SRPBCC family protein [Candidatus Tritonobacter lacicola]